MKRFLFRFLVFAAIQASIAAVVIYFGLNESEKISRRVDAYLLAMLDKYKLLQNRSRPRIILVGGSSLAFGIKSHKLVEAFDRPIVNMGVHVGLGLHCQLKMIEENIRKDDIVVLLPEYRAVSNREDFEGDMKLASMLVDLWPEGAQFFESGLLTTGQSSSGDPVLTRLHEACEGVAKRISSGSRNVFRNERPSVYRRSGFNEYGDLTLHYDAPTWEQRRRDLVFYSFDAAHTAFVKDALNTFADKCAAQGAKVFFGYQPVSTLSYEHCGHHYAALHTYLQHKLKFPVLYAPQAAVLPIEHFFDSPSHLNGVGAGERTNRLAQVLAPLVKNYVTISTDNAQ